MISQSDLMSIDKQFGRVAIISSMISEIYLGEKSIKKLILNNDKL